jgi:hypothetical protein
MKEYYHPLFRQFCNLHNLLEFVDVLKSPKKTSRQDVMTDEPLRASPNVMVINAIESREGKGAKSVERKQVHVIRRAPTTTYNIRNTLHLTAVPKKGSKQHGKAFVTLHRPGGPACLSDESTSDFGSLFHPEHPAAIFGQGMEHTADRSLLGMNTVIQDLEIPEVMDMGATIENIVLVFRDKRNLRKLWGWGREYEHEYSYLVLPKKGAEALGVLDECIPLSKKEREFIEKFDGWIPEDPVVLPYYDSEDDDRGGDDTPSPPESEPTPTQRPEPTSTPRREREPASVS